MGGRRHQRGGEGSGVGRPVRRGQGGEVGGWGVCIVVGGYVQVVQGVAVVAEDLRQAGDETGAVGHCHEATVSHRAVLFGVGGHRVCAEVVAAHEGQSLVHEDKLTVLVAVAGSRFAQEVDGISGWVVQALDDPLLHVIHPAAGAALQQDGHRHSGLDAVADHFVESDTFQSVGLDAQGVLRRGDGLRDQIQRPLRGHGQGEGGRGGDLRREEQGLQVPAGVAQFAPVDGVVGVLGPVGGGVRVGNGQAGGLVQLAVEHLPCAVTRVRVGDGSTAPARCGRAGAVGQRVHHVAVGVQQVGGLAVVGETGPGTIQGGDGAGDGLGGPVGVKAPDGAKAVGVLGQPDDLLRPDGGGGWER